jgi:acyl-coenzyme A synthetase/AMP-(fatty) acid ligase
VLGSVPIAYVIPQPDEPVDADALVADLTERTTAELTRFRRPVEIVVVPDLPRAPTGKIQRARVRSMAERS